MKKVVDRTIRFRAELDSVTPYLPACYGVLVQQSLPDLSRTHIYNVRHKGILDYRVLREFQKLALAHPDYHPYVSTNEINTKQAAINVDPSENKLRKKNEKKVAAFF